MLNTRIESTVDFSELASFVYMVGNMVFLSEWYLCSSFRASILKTVSIWQLVCQHAKDWKLTRGSSKFMPYCDTGDGEEKCILQTCMQTLLAQIVTGNH